MRDEPSTQVILNTGQICTCAPKRDVSVRTDQILSRVFDAKQRQRRSFLVYQRCVTRNGFIRVGRAFTARLARRKAAAVSYETGSSGIG